MNSRKRGFARATLTSVANSKGMWLVHVFTNASLIVAFFYWTRIPEETGLQFVLGVLSGLLIAFAALWLHSATFEYFRPTKPNLKELLRHSASNVPALLVWSVIFGLGLWLLGRLWNYDQQAGGWFHHLLPGFLRHAVSPRFVFSAASWFAWFLYFFLWPILWLPVGGQIALKNFRGFYSANAFRPMRELRFWSVYFVCFVTGAYVPYRLFWMTPTKPSTLHAQTWSMVIRFGAGYLLLVTAWLVLCAAIMRASDGDAGTTHEPTVATD